MSVPQWRREIDRIDEQVLELLTRRAELARQIGESKTRTRSQYFTPEREHAVLARLTRANHGPLGSAAIRTIYREIMSACRSLEKPTSVAYLGPEGTFSHLAAIGRFGTAATLDPVDSIAAVFAATERGESDYGLVPVENSFAGVVPETLDMFMNSNLRVVAEVYQPIAHNLLTRCRTLADVRVLYTHFQPLGQCGRWLRNHLPDVERIETSSSARAAELAAASADAAAIGTSLAADRYDIPVYCEHIEDDSSNRTRFLALGYNEPEPTGADKTSVMFSVPNRSGELVHALNAFDRHNVNLTMIESRPGKTEAWQYVFYIDAQGHQRDAGLGRALGDLRELAQFVRVLGSYPDAAG